MAVGGNNCTKDVNTKEGEELFRAFFVDEPGLG